MLFRWNWLATFFSTRKRPDCSASTLANPIDWPRPMPRWPKYTVHGADCVTTEQGSGKEFCCNLPNQCCDSHTARLAAVEAFYSAKTGEAAYKEAAYRSYNWVTYFQGLPGGAHAPFTGRRWFTDEFSDGPRRLMDAFWAVPEWAPSAESHLLGGLSPVTQIVYRRGSVTYSTFDADSTEVLRLAFIPETVTSGGRPLSRRQILDGAGYTFDDSTRVFRVHHVDSRDVDIQGSSDLIPPAFVTFDDPHLPAATPLSAVSFESFFDWGAMPPKIAAPFGKFGTFHLALVNPLAHAEFRFLAPRVFLGIDIYNDGPGDATLSISSPETQKVSLTLKPGELRRLRTAWQTPVPESHFRTEQPQRPTDNLAYQRD